MKTLDEKRLDLIKRMARGFTKNRSKIQKKLSQPEISQSEKRKSKLIDLNSSPQSWSGLENFHKFSEEKYRNL